MIAKGGIMVSINICRVEAVRRNPCAAGGIRYPLLPFAELSRETFWQWCHQNHKKMSHQGKGDSDRPGWCKTELQRNHEGYWRTFLLAFWMEGRCPHGLSVGIQAHPSPGFTPILFAIVSHVCCAFVQTLPLLWNPPFWSCTFHVYS